MASNQAKVTAMNPTLQLLNAKRSSALIDARKMEDQLARLSESADSAGIRTNLSCITRMFRDYIASLDEAIQASKASATELR